MLKKDDLGIDISYANGDFDIEYAISQGMKFVIIRCGYGKDYTNQDDSRFIENIRKCESKSIPYGVYLYSYALSLSDVFSEVNHTLRLLQSCQKEPVLGVYIDMEDADGFKQSHGMPSNQTLVNICDTFCREVSEAGYEAGVYASLSWFRDKLNDEKLDTWHKWVAQWNNTFDFKGDALIWQYKCPPSDKATPRNYDWNKLLKNMKVEKEMTQEEFNKMFEIAMKDYEKTRNAKSESLWSQQEGWHKKAIDAGITDGSRPRAPVTREENIAILGRLGLIDDNK